jgi:MYXO-CTERM domain-containing protein
MGLSAGQTFYFDVATSGGGNDPGVDHLSRSTPATPGWGTASIAGPFLSYTVTPAPGAVALLGVAGLIGARRRR